MDTKFNFVMSMLFIGGGIPTSQIPLIQVVFKLIKVNRFLFVLSDLFD